MRVQNVLFLFNSSNYMDITVRNYDCFRVVWKVFKVIEFLHLVGLSFGVEEIAMSFFDWKYWDFFDFFEEICGLGYGDASFVGGLGSTSIVDG